MLRRHPLDNKFDIFKARCEEKCLVFKHVSKNFLDLSMRLALDFPSCPRLRMHVDCSSQNSILVYPFFRDTLLALLKEDPDFPPDERAKIMPGVGEAVQQLHAKDWIHNDIKPDNILIDWTCNDDGNKVVTNVALGDFDITCELKEGETRVAPHAVGNVMWRSPEGQTGILKRASDIYSLGLYLYTIGAGEMLIIDDLQDLVKAGIKPEQEVVTRHFCYFGPVPESLYDQIGDEDWRHALQAASHVAELQGREQPMVRFHEWGQEVGKEAMSMLSGMTSLNPKARLKIDQVLAHPFWKEAIESERGTEDTGLPLAGS